MKLNPMLRADSYKSSHFLQYPPGATRVSSYIEPRGGAFEEIVFFGLQAFIMRNLMNPLTRADVKEANDFFTMHGVPFNQDGWSRIVDKHGGYLPLSIWALPEGTVHRPGIPQVQVMNTDPDLAPLTSYAETDMLRGVWYPSTVASLSRRAKQFIWNGLEITADDPAAEIGFKLHDFGGRGATSSDAAMLGGMGHLVNFMGTDTIEALVGARAYYGEPMAGFSIPATEHSTVTSWGREGESDFVGNYLLKHSTGLIACVADSYDVFNFARNIVGDKYKEDILNRDGTFVVRPDSGDPVEMPLAIIEILMEQFGFTENSKGYRVLPDQVRVIQGDGMNLDMIKRLIDAAEMRGISTSNFAVGMGGGLLQKVDRDTCKYAMKANAIEIDGEWRDVYKDPITDRGKKSKRGRQAVLKIDGELVARKIDDIPTDQGHGIQNQMREVYRNGELLVEDTFADIRERAAL